MKNRKSKKSPKKNEKKSREVANKEKRLNKEKEDIRTQIQSLKKLIENAKFTLQTTTFGDTEFFDSNHNLSKSLEKTRKVKNWTYILHYELCKLSGLYCTKYAKNECVYCFDPGFSGKSLFSVQLFTNDNKGTIGKSVMPAMDSIESIIAETPIEKLTGVTSFLKNCLRHTICFASRKQQFEKLKEKTVRIKNIVIDADMEFRLVTITLTDVYDKIADKMINMIVYLSYENGGAKPHMIYVDWSLKDKPSDEIVKAMKNFVKNFKDSVLYEALREIINKTHKIFSWKPTRCENVDSVNLKDISDSEEGSQSSEETDRPKKISRSSKRKRSSSLTPKRNARKKFMEEVEDPDSDLDDEKETRTKKKAEKPPENKKSKMPLKMKNPRKENVSESSEEELPDSDFLPHNSKNSSEKNVENRSKSQSKNINSNETSSQRDLQVRRLQDSSEDSEGDDEKGESKLTESREKRSKNNVKEKSILNTSKKTLKMPSPRQRLLNFKKIPAEKSEKEKLPVDKLGLIEKITKGKLTSTPKPNSAFEKVRKNLMPSLELSPIGQDENEKEIPASMKKKVEKNLKVNAPQKKTKTRVTKSTAKKKK